MTDPLTIRFTLNGRDRTIAVEPSAVLVDVLREQFGLTGTKIGCDQGVCGACTVLIDGRPMASCTEFAFMADGRSVVTIEGLGPAAELHPIQQAFIEAAAHAMRLLHARHGAAVWKRCCVRTLSPTKPRCAASWRARCAAAPAIR